MSHTTSVFENSYQTARFRDDLHSLAFGTSAEASTATFKSLCNTSLTRDPSAPISLTEGEMAHWETRRDVTQLRALISEAEGREKQKLQSKLKTLRAALEELELDKKRSKYFRDISDLRAHGIRPDNIPPEQARTTSHRPENMVFKFLNRENPVDDSVAQAAYLRAIFEYLQSPPIPARRRSSAQIKTPEPSPLLPGPVPERGTSCLLYDQTLCDRSSLTRHHAKHHLKVDFKPFVCPECVRLKQPEVRLESEQAWSNHVESIHGKQHAPNLASPDIVRCPFCPRNKKPFKIDRLLSHINRQHWSKPPSTCTECTKGDYIGTSIWDWARHLSEFHLPTVASCSVCGYLFSQKGLTRHIISKHKDPYVPVPCPPCQCHGNLKTFPDFESLHAHIRLAHPLGYLTEYQPNERPSKRQRELDLDSEGLTVTSPQKRLKTHHHQCDTIDGHGGADELNEDFGDEYDEDDEEEEEGISECDFFVWETRDDIPIDPALFSYEGVI